VVPGRLSKQAQRFVERLLTQRRNDPEETRVLPNYGAT
jgi:hypothetical protein